MHQHTQLVWEKEIRRQRKEYFKANSSGVKYAEELKTTKDALRTAESSLAAEKERSRAREQEAFAARYQIVGVQEQLEAALEKVKLVEQERDAFKTLAKNEEVARIAAEGCIPLPPPETDDDEFASPKKEKASLGVADVVSSAASEEEIDELTRQVEWERQRADRAQEHVEFLMAECELRCCPCAKSHRRRSMLSPRRLRPQTVELVDAGDLAILSQKASPPPKEKTSVAQQREEPREEEPRSEERVLKPKKKSGRRSTIFCPQEGIFRTVSQEEAEALGQLPEEETPTKPEPEVEETGEQPAPSAPTPNPSMYARTPSADPPTFALLAQERTSLMSLLNAPHNTQRESDAHDLPVIPTMQAPEDRLRHSAPEEESTTPRGTSPAANPARPHTAASFYTVTTTTTIPITDKKRKPSNQTYHRGPPRPPSRADEASFDANNPAMTPTMTREQALAQIRERRGRARSAAQGAATPRRQMVEGIERRDMSAPTGRAAKART